MTPLARRRPHRITFAAAGIYNIAWGLYAVADPQWFFRISGLPRSNAPQIVATLRMVLGLYGVLYLDVARAPERGWLVVIVVTNDLGWWVPFALYLRDAWPGWRSEWDPPARP